jgi:hypothetical protein
MVPCPCGLRGKIRNSERTVQRLKQNEEAMFTSCQQILVVESHKGSSSYDTTALYIHTKVETLYINATVMFMVPCFAGVKVSIAEPWGHNS